MQSLHFHRRRQIPVGVLFARATWETHGFVVTKTMLLLLPGWSSQRRPAKGEHWDQRQDHAQATGFVRLIISGTSPHVFQGAMTVNKKPFSYARMHFEIESTSQLDTNNSLPLGRSVTKLSDGNTSIMFSVGPMLSEIH